MRKNKTSRWNDWRALLAQVLSILSVVVFCAVATIGAFNGGLWGGAGIGYGLLLYFGTALLDRRWPRPAPDYFRLAAIALAVMALLNLGSSNSSISWYDWKRLITIFLPLILLTCPEVVAKAGHRRLLMILACAALIGAFALSVELFLAAPVLHMAKGDHTSLTQYNRGFSYLVILAFPILAALWTRPLQPSGSFLYPTAQKIIPFALFIAMMLLPASLTESRTSKLALVLALGTAAVAAILPNLVRRILTGFLFLLPAWPFVARQCFSLYHDRLSRIPDSWHHRLEIWDYMSYRILEHPILGWGLGTSRTLDYLDPHGNLYQFATESAGHPHNVAIQLWVELGLPGLALGFAFAFLTLRRASKLSRPLVPFAFGAWVGALCLSLVAYNFWTDSMFSAFALTGMGFALLDRQIKKDEAFEQANERVALKSSN
jgi:hypothetical protein